jgi:hypothetical protein
MNQIPIPPPGFLPSALPVGQPDSSDAYVKSNTSTPVIVPGPGPTNSVGPYPTNVGMATNVPTAPGQALPGAGMPC